jgi:hypothetical protein
MGYFEDFEQSLVQAAERQSTTRRSRGVSRLLIAAAILAVVALGITVVLAATTNDSVSASTISVQRTAQGVIVRVAKPTYPPREILEDLRSAGFKAELELLPTGPSEVGKFVSFSTAGLGARFLETHEILVPPDWDGTFIVSGTVAAEPGETYLHPSNAYAPGEPLDCIGGPGGSALDVAAVAMARKLTVDWVSPDNTSMAPSASLSAASATAASAHHVRIVLEPASGSARSVIKC